MSQEGRQRRLLGWAEPAIRQGAKEKGSWLGRNIKGDTEPWVGKHRAATWEMPLPATPATASFLLTFNSSWLKTERTSHVAVSDKAPGHTCPKARREGFFWDERCALLPG